ncbi:hypothetical protein T484DRAFT_1781852 [Baffinella frigidus]|nr:hypothetical protein T484DRAFT_1781852 [Cryptophyta sp. CCMP2293]
MAGSGVDGGIGPPQLWQDGALVTVDYAVTEHGGREVDSSAARGKALTFVLGARMACPTLDHSVRRMQVGEEGNIALASSDALDPSAQKDAAPKGSLRDQVNMWFKLVGVQDVRREAAERAAAALREALALKEAGNTQ